MSAYIIADVTVTNEAQMVEYRECGTRAMQEFGAEVLVRGVMPAALEGAWLPRHASGPLRAQAIPQHCARHRLAR